MNLSACVRRERDWIVEEGGWVRDFFDKTGVSSRLELALFAVRQRLVDED